MEKVRAGRNMARDDKSRPPVLVLRPDPELEKPKQHMVTLKTKYLPNLKTLVFPKMVYEQIERLVITPLLVYDHDPVAAVKLRGERCASFNLPKDLFPHGAPLWKIKFLPEPLLPLGFKAGGVFATGVLARKYYPIGLLSAQHKGQTPALFIGHRNSNCIIHKDAQAQKRSRALTPAPSPSPAYLRGILKPSAADMADMNRRLVRNNISVAAVVVMPAFPKPPSRYPSAVPIQMQYNMYVPDLSQVIFAMQEINCLTVAIISTIHQPNVPEAALSTMGDESCATFDLPTDVFPVDINRLGPRFLPQRFLPDFCDAGCVFPPGSLPDSVFLGAIRTRFELEQYHYTMTPPLFVGRRRPSQGSDTSSDFKVEPIAVQMEKMALKNILKQEAVAPGGHNRTNAPATIPEGAQRSNEFKKSAAAGRPKGFVLIESDHVPRGATRTDFFGAYIMGCFFKITPGYHFPVTFGTVGDLQSTSDGGSVEESTEDGEYLDFQDAKEYPETEVEEEEAQEYEAEEEEAQEYEAEEDEAQEYEAEEEEAQDYEAEAEESEAQESEAQESEAQGYEAEESEAQESETLGYEAQESETLGYEAQGYEAQGYEAEESEAEETGVEEFVIEEFEIEEIPENESEVETRQTEGVQDEDESEAEESARGETQTEQIQTKKALKRPTYDAESTQNGTDCDYYEPMDFYDSDTTESVGGCAFSILSYFTVDSNLDDIAEAAGNLDTARFEVIVHPSELPGIDVDRAIEQFREVLQCRNEIRAKMTGQINGHAEKMEADGKVLLGSPAPATLTKRVYRKPCSQCGKYH